MHFVMYAFNNHVKVLQNVTPIDLLAQLAVLSDGVVVACLHKTNDGTFSITPCRIIAQPQ